MELSEHRFEQIEAYLEGRLSKKALKQFEEQLQIDQALATSVELQKKLTKGIQKSVLFNLKNKLDIIHEQVVETELKEIQPQADEVEQPPVIPPVFWKPALLLGATFAILAVIYFLNSETPPINDKPVPPNEERVYAASRPMKSNISLQSLSGAIQNAAITITFYSSTKSITEFTWDGQELNLYWVGKRPTSGVQMMLIEKNNRHFDLKIENEIYKIFLTKEKASLEKRKDK